MFEKADDEASIAAEDHFHLWPGETREVALRPATGVLPRGTVTALNGRGAAHYRAAA